MKAPADRYKIEVRNGIWYVIRIEDGSVAKSAATYRTIRNWHAALALNLTYRQASKLRN